MRWSPAIPSWRGEWQSPPMFLPGESHGRRSPAGYSPWGYKESNATEQLTHAIPSIQNTSLLMVTRLPPLSHQSCTRCLLASLASPAPLPVSLHWLLGSLVVVQSVMSDSATPRTAARQTSLALPPPRACSNPCLLSLRTMPSNHLILCHPPFLSSVFPSIRVFSSESALPIKWPKY